MPNSILRINSSRSLFVVTYQLLRGGLLTQLKSLGLCFALCLAASNCEALESQLLIDGSLQLKIEAPKKPKASVLLIHGWAGHSNEVGDLYKNLAKELGKIGIASVRVNIRGESEREKTNFRLTSTFASRVQDAEIAFKYMIDLYPDLPIGVVGFSLGGATALSLISAYQTKIDSVVLWSSAGNPKRVIEMVPADKLQTILQDGEAKVDFFTTLTITRKHILGLLGHDVFSGLEKFKGNMLSIRGSEDFVEPIEKQLFDKAKAQREEAIVLYGADHIFNVLDPDKSYASRVLELTTKWLFDTLVYQPRKIE